MTWATFDENDHCVQAGWATYHGRRSLRRWRLRCWLGHHRTGPEGPPGYARCPRCRASLKRFVPGQHRWGGMDRPRSETRNG